MTERGRIPGKFVWFELVTSAPKKAQTFYREVLGWKTVDFPVGDTHYEMIFAGDTPDTMVGTYAPARGDGARSRWIGSVSVADVDAAVAAAVAHGGKVLVPSHDLPRVGRGATIADPSGAELALFRSANGDPPDVPSAPPGRFMWNELHTHDPDAALAFYEKVVGFTHHSVPSPAGPYHVLSTGGVDRGGITGHLPSGASPHWLPFVHVDDVDAAVERARKLGVRIPMEAKNLMDIGRLGIVQDPAGAELALMKPRPRATP